MIACVAAYGAYLDFEAQELDHTALVRTERQRDLASALGATRAGGSPHMRAANLAAGDANLRDMLAGGAQIDDPALSAQLDDVRAAWSAFRAEVLAGAPAPAQAASRERLLGALGTLEAHYDQHLRRHVRADAGRQIAILTGAALLLAWASLAIIQAIGAGDPRPEDLAGAAEAAGAEGGGASPARAGRAWAYEAQGQPHGGLGAPQRDGSGLAHELRLYAADFRQMAGISVDLAIDERAAEAVPSVARTQTLNIAREAIERARRSAHATRVSVGLWHEASHVWLSVADNGTTDDGAGREPPSLSIMRARAERLGGELRVSQQAGGTMVLIRLPAAEPMVEHPGAARRPAGRLVAPSIARRQLPDG